MSLRNLEIPNSAVPQMPKIPSIKKSRATIVNLGRQIILVKAQQQGQPAPNMTGYRDRLYDIGLGALAEIPNGDEVLLTCLQECARRDSGVKHLLNAVFTGIQTKILNYEANNFFNMVNVTEISPEEADLMSEGVEVIDINNLDTQSLVDINAVEHARE